MEMMGRALGCRCRCLLPKGGFFILGDRSHVSTRARHVLSVSKIFNKHKPFFLTGILVSREVCVVMTPILQIRKLRHRKVM